MVRKTTDRANARVLRLFAAASVAVLGMASRSSAAEVTATWGGTTDNWSSTTAWSTAPNYPNNGTPAGTVYNAVIDSAGAAGPYTVTLDIPAAVNSLSLNNANATLTLAYTVLDLGHADGSLGVANLQAGRFNLLGGRTLANATLAVNPSVAFQTDLGRFQNVRLAGDWTLPAGNNLIVYNTAARPVGLDLNGFTLGLAPGASISYASDTVAYGVDGTINLGGSGATIQNGLGGLTLNAGTKINALGTGTNKFTGRGAFTNNGLITVAAGTTFTVTPSTAGNVLTFTNNGTIQLTGTGTVLNLGGGSGADSAYFSNTGKILGDPDAAVAATQTFELSGRFHPSDLGLASSGTNGTFTPNGASVSFSGAIDNAGNTLTFGSGSGVWTFRGGAINSGTLVAQNRPDGTSYASLVGAVFRNVKLGADLTLSTANGTISVQNQASDPLGLDFNGHTVNVTGQNVSFNFVAQYDPFKGTYLAQNINGNVNLIGNGAELYTGQGPTTIDANVTITASSGGSNTVEGVGGAATLTNNGVISVTNGTRLNLNPSTFINHGTLAVHNGTIASFQPLNVGDGTLTGSGTIAGDLALASSSPSTLALAIAGRTRGTQYDSLTITGQATLGGNLSLTLADGFVPLPGDAFTVLAAGSLSGTFLNVADGGRLTDTTGAGSFLVQYGSGAHANEIFLSNFQPVPEPASAGLLAVGLVGLAMRRRRNPQPCLKP